MEDRELFELFGVALGLPAPWRVGSVCFDKDAGELQIGLEFPRGSVFACPEAGCANSACSVHDTLEKRWRHLDFFEHRAFLVARVPRVRCATHGVHLVEVAWARPGSGFSLLMEMAMLSFAKQMPIAPLAKMAREHDTRIWRVVEHYVNTARASLDFSEVTQVGMDETSARRGQDYVSIFMDLSEHRVMFATPGRDSDTVKAFATDLQSHGGQPKTQLEVVCCDMSAAFVKGIRQNLSEQADEATPEQDIAADQMPTVAPGSTRAGLASGETRHDGDGHPLSAKHSPTIIFDRYHVVAKANEAVDKVRRAEAKTRPELKSSRYVWLKNEPNLTVKQRETLLWLSRPSMNLQTARAARWRDDFNGFYDITDPTKAEAYLRRWCYGAKRSRLEPIKDFVRMVEAHWEGVIAWQTNRITNGLLEGTNSLIQAAKRRARGYRTKEKMITIIYLIAGKLPLPTIHTI